MQPPIGLTDEAADLLKQLLQHWRRLGPWQPTTATAGGSFRLPEPAYMHNDSGETIPPYACCQVTGTIEISGQNYLLVDKPADTDGTSGRYVFNGHNAIADNEEGKWQNGQIVRAFKDSGSVTAGGSWGPTSGQWYLTSGSGDFIACGADDIDDDVFKVFTSVGGGGIRLFVAELKEAWSSGVAECDIYSMDGTTLTDTTTDADVYDPLGVFSPLGTGDRMYVTLQDGKYYAVNNAPCPSE